VAVKVQRPRGCLRFVARDIYNVAARSCACCGAWRASTATWGCWRTSSGRGLFGELDYRQEARAARGGPWRGARAPGGSRRPAHPPPPHSAARLTMDWIERTSAHLRPPGGRAAAGHTLRTPTGQARL